MTAIPIQPDRDAGVWFTGRVAHPSVRHAGARRSGRVSPATYRRRRVTIAVIALGLVLAAGRAGGALGSSSPLAAPERRPASAGLGAATSGDSGVVRVVVHAGDTLWSIVERLAPGRDPRPVVDELSRERHGRPLQPGETVVWSP